MQKLYVAIISMTLAGHASAQDPPGVVTRVVPLIGTGGKVIGEVTVRGSASATLARISVALGGLTPGWHAVHFHAAGDCSDVEQFQSAKGVLDHVVKSHGLLHPEGPQEGDLPNIYANADGSANAEVSSHAVRMLGDRGLIERRNRSALIIHASEDDHASQPTGNSGPRVACAVLK
jgi:Cu-Zn family superoxide dismutase